MNNKKSFEECAPEILEEIEKFRSRWTLKAIVWYDFDDVKSIIFNHIYNKFDMWDQERPLKPYLKKSIRNQIKNLLRNKYYKFQRPCEHCPSFKGDNICSIFGSISTDCALYKKWFLTRKRGCDVQLPVTTEDHANEIKSIPSDNLSSEENVDKIHKHMLGILPPYLKKIYTLLYIEHKTDEETATILGYKTKEKNRIKGYKMIYNYKKTIIKLVKQELKNDKIDII